MARNALVPMAMASRVGLTGDAADPSQFVAQELLADNDELRETNHQLIASMEEIQSLNVALQSVNEALHSTNVELRAALDQTRGRSADLEHMLNGIDVAAVLMNEGLEVRDYNATAARFFALTKQDIGRSIARVRHDLVETSLLQLCRQALDNGEPVERTISSESGSMLALRIREVDVGGPRPSVMLTVSEVSELGPARYV
jgi:nitrogen fixation/metabolism regulation signal transduction histidine kinase